MAVVILGAQFDSEQAALGATSVLQNLCDAYAQFEATDPDPWATDRVPPPLLELGEKFGFEWPNAETERFLLKGSFAEVSELLQVDRLLFFWAHGFELGGASLQKVVRLLGATHVTGECDLTIHSTMPLKRADELAEFLDEEGCAGQFSRAPGPDEGALHTITFRRDGETHSLNFDRSGSQDWAFVSSLPQLAGEDPKLESD